MSSDERDDDDTESWQEFNAPVIAQYRENGGRITSGHFEGVPLILLHTIGAKSGLERVSPVTVDIDGDRLVIIASRGGDDRHPDWFHNLVAHPEVVVELGSDTLPMTASLADEPERTRLFDQRAAWRPAFREYQDGTERVIPVVILSPDPSRTQSSEVAGPRPSL